MSFRNFAESVYTRLLRWQLTYIPMHVAIIPDGNRRFANANGKDTGYGHRLGADTTERVLDWMSELGIRHITFYAFSTENFKRPEDAKAELLRLFIEKFGDIVEDRRVYENQINITVIGDRSLLDPELLEKVEAAEEATRNHSRYYVHFALAYGGRNEIVTTAQRIVSDVRSGKLIPEEITPDAVTRRMYPEIPMPPVDLIIRTANDRRTSNFLPWLANGNEAAVCFCTPTWPEFRYVDMLRALRTYDQRMQGA